MASRSTRNKLRFQSKKALKDIDHVFEHYHNMDVINDNQSSVININLPPLIVLLDEVKKVMVSFDKML